jgi:hypothetical protein
MTEAEVFEWFAEARRELTGATLTDVIKSERPDFLANDSLLGEVGIEITDARPEMSEDDIDFAENWMDVETFDYLDASDHIYRAIRRKDRKRRQSTWQRGNAAILVARTFADVREVRRHLSTEARADIMPTHGFKEIWIQDSELTFSKDGDARSAAIVCLHPARRWLDQLVYSGHREMPYTMRHDYIGGS